MASATILDNTPLICSGHFHTFSGSIKTHFVKCVQVGLGRTASVQDLIKTPGFIGAPCKHNVQSFHSSLLLSIWR